MSIAMLRRMTLARNALGLLLAIVLLFGATAFAEDVHDAAEQARQLALQGNPEQALATLRELGEQGNAKAQLYAGIMLSAGEGTAPNRVAAVKLWLQAADQNLAEAQFRVGTAYAAGEGVPADLVEGAMWLILAGAEEGMAFQLVSGSLSETQISDARQRAKDWRQANTGKRFTAALEIANNKQRATELAALASEGYAPAQYQFALLHQLGIPDAIPSASKVRVPGLDGLEWRPNDVEAVRYFRMAAEQNYAPAMVGLAAALEAGKGVEQDTGEALAFYELAAEKGDLHGKWGLADMLLDGRGAPADWGRGLGLLTEVASASAENYEAQAELAGRYLDHPGADLRVAYMWYAIAAHGARAEYIDGLADDYDQARLRLEPLMSSGEIDTAKAMAGTCLSTSYRRCRPPELLDGVAGLFGY